MPSDRTIYVVDDDAGVRRSLEQLLDAEGFAVMSFDSATAFLEAAPGLAPGCILPDVRMPEMDGLELQERLRDLDIAQWSAGWPWLQTSWPRWNGVITTR